MTSNLHLLLDFSPKGSLQRHDPFSQARVACAEGFVSSGNVTSVTLVCESVNATVHRWIPGDEGLLPEDLLCGESLGVEALAVTCADLLLVVLPGWSS